MSAFSKTSTRRGTDQLHFRIIYMVTLPAFAVVALISRLSTGLGGSRPGGIRRPSILSKAKASAQVCASAALMG